jgi:hypothetical protein
MSKTRPDAVRVPRNFATGRTADERKESVVEVAEVLLECGPIELAWCHDQIKYFFCTRDPEDTEQFPDRHRRARQPRYHWIAGPDGTELGYLVSDE